MYLTKQTKQKLINELLDFCSQPSVATQNIGMEEMVKIIENKLKDLGAKTRVVKAGKSFKYILADIKASDYPTNKKTVLFYNHYDVQPVGNPSEWKTDPFKAVYKKGKVYARGVADNKGDLLSRIQLIRILKEEGSLPVNIKWLIEGEEEIGSPNLQLLQEKYGDFWKNCDVCIWEDGRVDGDNRGIVSLGMKGILYVELKAQFNKTDLHSKLASVVDSPTWYLIQALNTLRNSDGTVLIKDFYKGSLQPTVAEKNLIEHSLVSPKNIAGEAAQKYLVQPADKKDFLNRAYFSGTCNICGIWSGYTVENGIKTIVPNSATAKLDFRLVYKQDPNEIEKLLRKHLNNHGFGDIEINVLAKLYPTKTNIENKYVQKSLEALREVTNKEPVIDITALGGGPTYHVAQIYGIPTVEIGVGYPACNMHGSNENIRVADYFNTINVLEKYLAKLADI